MAMKRLRLALILLALAAVAAALALIDPRNDEAEALFDHPRVVHLTPDGRLLVTDLGTGNGDGRVLALTLKDSEDDAFGDSALKPVELTSDRVAKFEVLMDNLPSTRRGAGHRFAGLAGPSGAAMAPDGTVCVVIGEATVKGKGFGTMRCTDGLVVDLAKYEQDHNPDGKTVASDPYDIVWEGPSGWYVTDAAANTILAVDAGGTVRLVETYPQLPSGHEAGPTGLGVLRNARGDPLFDVALFWGQVLPVARGSGLRLTRDDARPIAEESHGKSTWILLYGDGPESGSLTTNAPENPFAVIAAGLDRPTGFAHLSGGDFVVCEEERGRCLLVTGR